MNHQLNLLVKEDEYALYPKQTVIEIILVSVFVIIISLSRGGQKFASLLGVTPCGGVYHAFNAGISLCLYLWVRKIIRKYLAIEEVKASLGYAFPNGRLSKTNMFKYAETGIIAGLIGGMLGIGKGGGDEAAASTVFDR